MEQLGEIPMQILMRAQECAHSLGDVQIGTEHILLGLLSLENAASIALNEFEVTYNEIFGELEEIRSGQNALAADVEVTALTDRARRVLELSFLEARLLKHDTIGPEHLMLAIIRLGQGVAVGILTKIGVNLVDLEIALLYQCSSVIAAPLQDVEAELCTQIEVWNRLGVIAREQGYEDLVYQSTQHTKMYQEALLELHAAPQPEV